MHPTKTMARVQGTVEETRREHRALQCDGNHGHGKLTTGFINPHAIAFESRGTASYPDGLARPWAVGVQNARARLLGDAAALSGAAAAPRVSLEAAIAIATEGFRARSPPHGGGVRLKLGRSWPTAGADACQCATAATSAHMALLAPPGPYPLRRRRADLQNDLRRRGG